MAYHDELAIANEFIRRAKRSGRPLTHMQVQKLVYIASGWSLALLGDPLTENEPQAWDYGPVFPKIWQELKKFGSGPIEGEIRPPFMAAGKSGHPPPYTAEMSANETSVIDEVWDSYGQMSGLELSQLTHKKGSPWFRTFIERGGRSAPIPNSMIQDHYTELADRADDTAATAQI